MIVVFGGEKGGTGKSTIATNMAAMLAMSGKDTLLLDTDRQGTASAWAGSASAAIPLSPRSWPGWRSGRTWASGCPR